MCNDRHIVRSRKFCAQQKSVQASSVKNGLSAYELAVQQGYAGSLDDWLVSLQGKSAYQIAVDNGYSGSEKDWSKTLTAMSKKDKSDISSAAFSEKGDLVITLSDGTKSMSVRRSAQAAKTEKTVRTA